MSRAWMPLYIGDYLADTQHLTTTQHGAYLLLIMHYWQHGGLPKDDEAIAWISRLKPDQWRSNCKAIAALFEPGWKHKRIERELEKARIVSEKRTLAGAVGGRRSAGLNNQERRFAKWSSEAIAKQTGAQSHKKDKKEAGEKKLSVSASLTETLRAKGWV
jgi:uncharacterized protein YdaU (DUF1376 family)